MFPATQPFVIGTVGFARMFEHERLFDRLVPELVLTGLKQAAVLNCEPGRDKNNPVACLAFFKSKIHRATVNAAEPDYQGPISLGRGLSREAGQLELE